MLNLLTVHQFDHKKRLGESHDGGYVIGVLNEETPYDCYISAGLGAYDNFSLDFIKMYHLNETNSFGFDGTIQNHPYGETNIITFVSKNISDRNDNQCTNLSDLIEKYDHIFLKMDIEGGEYPWILSLRDDQLIKFKQIVIEFHGIYDNGWGTSFSNKHICLEKLARFHYLIHAHGNNCAHRNELGIPYVIEFTYVNKNCFSSMPMLNTTPLPIPDIDSPNSNIHADFDLNFIPFTFPNRS